LTSDRGNERLDRLRKELASQQVDGMLLMVEEGLNWESVFYLSGFRGSSSAILVTPSEEFLITDGRYLQQASEQSSFKLISQGRSSLMRSIKELVREKKINYLGFEGDKVFYAHFRALEELGIQFRDLSGLVPSLRRFKDEKEIGFIEKAAAIASEAFLMVLERLESGISERDLANDLEYTIKSLGAEGGWPDHGFVVVSGPRSSLPHGVPTSRKINPGDWVTVDFGAAFEGYVSDITRNFVIGEPDARAKEVHQILQNAHLTAAAELAPGVKCRDIDGRARKCIEDAGYGEFFNHGLGHGIGLEVHEKPRLSSLSEDVLEPGDVVTVEPGIYIPETGGMRLEDDYLITRDGARRLTSDLAQELFLI